MVCVPCFIVPILLFIFHKFLQPIILKYWNPWGTQDEKLINEKVEKMLCKDGVCYKKKEIGDNTPDEIKLKSS